MDSLIMTLSQIKKNKYRYTPRMRWVKVTVPTLQIHSSYCHSKWDDSFYGIRHNLSHIEFGNDDRILIPGPKATIKKIVNSLAELALAPENDLQMSIFKEYIEDYMELLSSWRTQ